MRVLRVIAGLDPRVGGPVESTVSSIVAIQGEGIETHAVVAGRTVGAASAVARLEGAGVVTTTFSLLPGRAAARVSLSPSLLRWLGSNVSRYDIVHAHGAWTASSLAALVAARCRRVPYVLTPHESLTDHDVAKSGAVGRRLKCLLRALYRRYASTIVFSSDLERRDSLGLATDPVISHPVEALTHGRRSDGCLTRVGFLGRFDPKKNLDLLLRSLPEDAELLIAGGGPAPVERSLRALAADLGVAGRVRWLGFIERNRRREFFEAVDVVALPSDYECFGMAAAEALAAGVPVVVGRRTGIAPLVRRHDCGFVIDLDVVDIHDALAGRDALAEKRRRTASAAAELSPNAHAIALAKVYTSCLLEVRS